MSDNLAESILRKMVEAGVRGGYFGIDASEVGDDSWITVDLHADITAEEEAYLRQMKAAVERDRETDR